MHLMKPSKLAGVAVFAIAIGFAFEVFAQDQTAPEEPTPADQPKQAEPPPAPAKSPPTVAETEKKPEPPQSLFIFSAIGPGQGHGTIGMGGRVYLFVPTYDLHYVRGLTNSLDFFFSLNSLAIINLADIGLRFRLFGDPDSGFSFALKGSATPFVFFIGVGGTGAAATAIGATPGALVSFGGRSVQFTFSFDVPIFFGGAFIASGSGSSSSGSNFQVTEVFRPAATIEFPASVNSTNMYVQAAAYISNSGQFFGPILAVGAAW